MQHDRCAAATCTASCDGLSRCLLSALCKCLSCATVVLSALHVDSLVTGHNSDSATVVGQPPYVAALFCAVRVLSQRLQPCVFVCQLCWASSPRLRTAFACPACARHCMYLQQQYLQHVRGIACISSSSWRPALGAEVKRLHDHKALLLGQVRTIISPHVCVSHSRLVCPVHPSSDHPRVPGYVKFYNSEFVW